MGNKSKGFALFFILIMVTSALSLLAKPVNAQYTQDGTGCPLVSPVEITSPTNSTYTADSLTLSFYINSLFDNTIYQYELSYSVDGKENISISSSELSFSLPNGDTGPFTNVKCSGSISLPQLDEGGHQLNVYATYVRISTNRGNYPSLIYSNSTVNFTILQTPTFPNKSSTTTTSMPILDSSTPSSTPTVPEVAYCGVLLRLFPCFNMCFG